MAMGSWPPFRPIVRVETGSDKLKGTVEKLVRKLH